VTLDSTVVVCRLRAAQLGKIMGGNYHLEITVNEYINGKSHLLMVPFHRPTKKRYKIICEEKKIS
jgi:kynureninase